MAAQADYLVNSLKTLHIYTFLYCMMARNAVQITGWPSWSLSPLPKNRHGGLLSPKRMMMKSPLRYLSAFAFAASLLLSGAASAQTPVVTLDGLPAEPLIGESACFDAVFENTSGTIGYGPYLVVAYPPNLDVESVNFINQNASSELIGTFDATGVLTDPITGDPINGLENGQAFLYRYPIGAVAQSSPDFSLRICTKPSVAAELNAALPVSVTPGFEFGDTAEGTNGPVTTNAVIRNVTPVLARIKKTHSAPENERPPGPSHPFTYTVVVDVSDQATIDNVQLDDILSNKLQWTGTNASDITVTAANGTNCAVNTTPNVDSDSADKDVNNPGGTLTVTCDSLTGTAGPNDLSFSFEVFAVDILAEGVNNSQDIVNNEVTMNGNYDGAAIPPLSDNTDVTIRQSTMVKSVSGSNTPGSTDLVYTLNFRVSDYTGGASAYTLVDELPDGISYTASSTNITINGAAQTPPEPTVANNTPNAGQTRLTWNLRSIFGADLPAGAVGTISYAGSIDQYYAGDTEAVAANDTLTNNAETDYTLTEGGVSQNTSSASILIPPNTLRKSIIDPNPVPATFTPGQAVTFRLEMTIPAGSTDDVVITDFMPLPVIPVGSAVGAADSSITSVTIPTDPTFLQESSPGGDLLRDHMVVTVDASNNSVSVAFDNDIVVVTTQIIAVDIATVITSDPYADGLVLSNLMQMEYNNSNPVLSSELFTINIELDAPELNITAGVTAADNPAATFTPAVPADPSTELADSDVGNIDAADILTYTFTVENTGGSSAHNVLITSPVVAGLNCNDGSVTVVNGNGTNLGFSGNLSTGITLNDPLDGNDDNPVGGGAPFGSDTALVSVQCTVNSSADVSSTLTKTAEATWTATAASTETFPAVNDTADATLTSPSVEKSYSTIVPVGAAAAANIGEIVTYQLVVTVPEGEMPAARVVDTLPPGMAVVDVVSVTGSAGLSSSQGPISGIAATVSDIGAAAIDQGRRLTLDFGTLTNSNSNNAVAETITIEFRAQVLNVNTNVQGHALINSAALNWTPTGGNQQSASATSDPITVNEPTLTVSKSFSETTGDGGANFTGTIVITNTSGTDAYDVQLADLLAGDMHYSNISFAGNCGVHTDNYDGAATPESLDVSWDTFAAGDTCTITYDVSFDTNPVAGAVLTAPVDLQWHSIAGAPPATSPHNTFGVERTGNTANPGQSNDYRTNNSATFTVSGAAISKTLKSTDSTLTDGLAVTPAGGSALTVGESITFTITVTIPEVDVSNLVVSDTLPTTGMDFEITDTQVVRVGANGDITAATPNPTPVYSNSGGAANNDTVTLTFGAVTHNILDGTNTDDEIVIEIDAIVLDVTANANGNEADNSASVDFGGTAVATALYPMEVAEPILEISKSVNPNPATAGDTVTYTVTVSHDAASTMSASDVSVSDTLPAGLTLVNGSSGTGTCPSAPTSSSTTGNAFSASWNEFPLGASCELTYQATVNTNAVYGDNINNTAALKWHSLPDTFGDRREYNRSDTETLTVSEPGVNIVMVDSSNW
ncbi:MAG: hypothetical protein CSA53_02355 [Gammaproteobacteria bacterium]|nr:MAG: hypothetical protein CSA53_02355 [Gammaproteobacteria bacterium]